MMNETYCYISDEFKFIWYLIPKNASSSLRAALADKPYNAIMNSRRNSDRAPYKNHIKFAFFRDPVERALSAYQEVSYRVDTLKEYNHDLRFALMPDTMKRFEVFLEEVEERPWDDHVSAQCDLVRGVKLNFVGRVEYLQTDYDNFFRSFFNQPSRALPKIRSRESRMIHQNYRSYFIRKVDLSERLLRKIENIFSEDIDYYNAI